MSGVFCFVDYNKNYNQLKVEDFVTTIYQHPLYTYEDQAFSFSSLFSCQDSYEGKLLDLDDLTIIFDGVLYSKDEKYKYLSDVEILQIEYASLGSKLFQKLDGVFSLIIYDKKLQKIYIVKDRVGVKPLYFYQKDNTFIFGSSLKYFSKTKFFEKELDKDSLAIYLQYGYIIQPNTIFKNTYKIKSGHFLEFDLKTQNIQDQKYWSLEECYLEEKAHISESEIITDIHQLLKKSIEKRIDKNLSMGSSLSGGYDSSMIAALLQARSETKIDTFTIGFDEDSINEAPFAKKIATYLGTSHTEHYFSAKDALRIVPTLCQAYDEPFADYGATPTVLMAQLIKLSGFDDIWVGDGGDEVFVTADDVAQFDKLLKLQPLAKKSISNMLNIIKPYKIPYLNKYQNIPTKYYKVLELLNAKTIPQMVKVKPVLFFDDEIEALLGKKKILTLTTFDEIDFSP
jgi:asparagine synthase (glutamine-hydrolysing)